MGYWVQCPLHHRGPSPASTALASPSLRFVPPAHTACCGFRGQRGKRKQSRSPPNSLERRGPLSGFPAREVASPGRLRSLWYRRGRSFVPGGGFAARQGWGGAPKSHTWPTAPCFYTEVGSGVNMPTNLTGPCHLPAPYPGPSGALIGHGWTVTQSHSWSRGNAKQRHLLECRDPGLFWGLSSGSIRPIRMVALRAQRQTPPPFLGP